MYDQVAPYYDLIHQELKDDILFAIRLASIYGGRILELGCGTGRLLLPFARTGHSITGLDNSETMLNNSRQKISAETKAVQQRISLVQGDMTKFHLDGNYGMAIMPHNTLLHLAPLQVAECFECVRQQLKPEGHLLIDVDNPVIMADPAEDDLLILERKMVDPSTGNIILQMASSWVDEAKQTRQILWTFDTSPIAGGPVNRTVVETKLHYQYLHEIELSLHESGFELEAVYGGYDEEPYGEDSPRLLALATQKKNLR
jgi:ubiquinone/menaquinone biosynthesis C-methylase UbiE